MSYTRRKTREVSIGNIKIGGNNPIAVQSMTNTDTRDRIKGLLWDEDGFLLYPINKRNCRYFF